MYQVYLSEIPMFYVIWLLQLGRWRFVVHSAIDGFSRKILYMKVANNNKASTALNFFKRATMKQMPSRLRLVCSGLIWFYSMVYVFILFFRIDKGSENKGIMAYFMWMRGAGRSSVIAGRSVHNVRIERHWRDARALCMGKYRKKF